MGGIRRISLTNSISAIVTGCAVINDTSVIKDRWHKCRSGYVTDITVLCCIDMWRGRVIDYTDCYGAIVAGHTRSTHNVRASMIHECRRKTQWS